MKVQLKYSWLLLVLFWACGGNSGEANSAIKETENASKKVTESCLVEMAMSPCDIISLSEIAALVPAAESEIEMEPPHEILKSAKMMQCSFSWDSDRTMTIEVMNRKITTPVDNMVAVGMINILSEEDLNEGVPTYEDWFRFRYKNMTEEDIDMVEDQMDEEMEDKSDVEKEAASSIVKMATSFHLEEIEGIGDVASWEVRKSSSEGILHILHGNVKFTIVSNISDDPGENLDQAKIIAKAVLAKCD